MNTAVNDLAGQVNMEIRVVASLSLTVLAGLGVDIPWFKIMLSREIVSSFTTSRAIRRALTMILNLRAADLTQVGT